MRLYVLFGQRKERYDGEYALEALAVFTEYDNDDNPAYLEEQYEKHRKSEEFAALKVVTLEVCEGSIRTVLFPEVVPIKASVVKNDDV